MALPLPLSYHPMPPYPPPPPQKPAKNKDATKDKAKQLRDHKGCPPLLSGTNYLFHTHHTLLHIFCSSARIWEQGNWRGKPRFKIFKVATNFRVRDLIEKLRGGPEGSKGWCCTEVLERGGGAWDKATTFEYGTDAGKKTLGDLGWNSKRGDTLPPTWLVVHKKPKLEKKDDDD